MDIKLGGVGMKKYIRAMFYGSTKTKAFLWTICTVVFASIICLGASILGAGIGFTYVAFGGIVFAITYSQLAVFKDVSKEIALHAELESSIANRNKQVNVEEKAVLGDDNAYNHYTEEKMNKLFETYRVKKENYCVLIDSYPKYKLKACPAYIWSDKNHMFIMALEKKPRIITISREETGVLQYEKGVIVKDIEEYKKVKESIFLSEKFQTLYPNYYKNTVNGLTTFVKNLFVIAGEIRITTPSAYGVIMATQCRLELTDKQIDRKRFGGYFEEIYKEQLLKKEGAYTPDIYNEKLREHLVVLAEHEENLQVFQNILQQLVQYRFMPHEYAEFYMEYRRKLDQKKVCKRR